jgi:hypothetical protein
MLFSQVAQSKEKMNEDGSNFSYGFVLSALMKMGKSTDSIKSPKK